MVQTGVNPSVTGNFYGLKRAEFRPGHPLRRDWHRIKASGIMTVPAAVANSPPRVNCRCPGLDVCRADNLPPARDFISRFSSQLRRLFGWPATIATSLQRSVAMRQAPHFERGSIYHDFHAALFSKNSPAMLIASTRENTLSRHALYCPYLVLIRCHGLKLQ